MIRADRAGYDQLSGCGLNLMTRDELDQIHYGTLEVLEQAGLMVFSDEAQEIYYSHGCKVDKEKKTVKIPPYLVEEAIQSAPSKLLLAARDPKYDLILGGTRVYFATFGVGVQVLDLETDKIRESTGKDMTEVSILCDALENLELFGSALTARDVPVQIQDLYSVEIGLNNCTKHFHTGEILSKQNMRRYFEMGKAVAGGDDEFRQRPICSVAICPVSPMQLSSECCEVIVESARLGLICNILSMALSGATAPVTDAGTLIVHNAEVLGGITLSQLTKKGAPVIYGSSTTMFDLTLCNAPVGTPEMGMISAAVAKLAQYYKLPSYVSGT